VNKVIFNMWRALRGAALLRRELEWDYLMLSKNVGVRFAIGR